jgi:protein kinase C substrate 80K-H
MPGSRSGTTNTSNALPGFWCANAGHIGAYVPFMYVNDGVCDYDLCCDGSEEYGGVGGIKCENKCGEIGREWKRAEEERRKSIERSAKKRRTLAKESKQLRKQVEDKIASLKAEIKALEVKRDDLNKKYEDIEREERGKVVKSEGTGKLGVLLSMAKSRVEELRSALDRVLDQRDDLKDRVAELEDILKKFKEEYNPNFNDEGVKQAVKSWEDYSANYQTSSDTSVYDIGIMEVLKEDGENSGINWKEFEVDDVTDTDICK